MANPNRPITNTTGISTTGESPFPPPDFEEIRQIQLLAEAVLVSFTATPNPLAPYGRATLAWQITMPTTVIAGVHVEVHLSGETDQDQVVQPSGSRQAAPYGDTRYAIYLRSPLAARQLGTVDLAVDFGACKGVDTAPSIFSGLVKGEANKAFPPGQKVKLRGDGATIDIGLNAFVVDIPLEAEVPNWFNADIDVSLGFSVFTQDGRIGVTHDFARATVSFGARSALLSSGCTVIVAKALEELSDGFLSGFIGPVVAGRLADKLSANVDDNLMRLNNANPAPTVPYRFYDLTLSDVGMTYRFCPAHPAPPGPARPPLNDRFETIRS